MGLLSALFGGSKSSSENKAFGQINKQLTPVIGAGTNAVNSLNDLTAGGFQGFLKNAGFNFNLGEGLKGITGGAAAGGLLRSGGTGKAFTKFAGDLRSNYLNNYTGLLGNIAGLGLNAAGTVAGAGATSKGSSNGGIIPGLFGG